MHICEHKVRMMYRIRHLVTIEKKKKYILYLNAYLKVFFLYQELQNNKLYFSPMFITKQNNLHMENIEYKFHVRIRKGRESIILFSLKYLNHVFSPTAYS